MLYAQTSVYEPADIKNISVQVDCKQQRTSLECNADTLTYLFRTLSLLPLVEVSPNFQTPYKLQRNIQLLKSPNRTLPHTNNKNGIPAFPPTNPVNHIQHMGSTNRTKCFERVITVLGFPSHTFSQCRIPVPNTLRRVST